MLKKLLSRRKATENVGEDIANLSEFSNTEIVTYLSLPQVEDLESIKLIKKITIGSEVGDLILEDDAISARHCSFILNGDIISLMDHSSEEGTYINKKRLSPGRTYILNEKDKVRVADLDVTLEKVEEPVENVGTFGQVEEISTQQEPTSSLQPLAALEEESEIPDLPEIEETEVQEAETSSQVLDEFEDEDKTGEFETPVLEESEAESFDFEEPDFEAGPSEPSISDEEVPEESAKQRMGTLSMHTAGGLKLEGQGTVNIPALKEKVSADDESLEKELIDEIEGEFEVDTVDVEEVEFDESILGKKEDIDIEAEKEEEIKASPVKVKAGKQDKKAKVKVRRDPAASTIPRVFGIANDVFISLIIIEIFYVFVDFQNTYKELPGQVLELLEEPYKVFLMPHVNELMKAEPAFKQIFEDISNFESGSNLFSFFLLFLAVRIGSSLVFKVSIGQYIAGLYCEKSNLKARLLAPFRVILGAILAPFIIFDLPALFSKRTSKEVITGTHFQSRSKVATLLFCIFGTSFLTLAFFMAPMVKGLEMLPPITVGESNLKVRPWNYVNRVRSKSLKMSYDLSESLTTLPSFRIQVRKKKRMLKTGILFVYKPDGTLLEVKRDKSFSFLKMYQSFVKLNLASEYFQPNVYALVNNVALNNNNFKFKIQNKLQLIEETKAIIKAAFTLEPSTIPQFIVDNGPMANGFRDFREKFSNLYPDKIMQIDFITLGKKQGVYTHHLNGKNKYYAFLPLGELSGDIYIFDKNVSSVRYKNFTWHLRFDPAKKGQEEGVDKVAEFVHSFQENMGKERLELNHEVYTRFFYLAKYYIEKNDFATAKSIGFYIQRMLTALGENKNINVKLYQNLSELHEAIKKSDATYFGLQSTETV